MYSESKMLYILEFRTAGYCDPVSWCYSLKIS